MRSKRIQELVNKFIDGEINASEKEELDVLLEIDENRKYFESMASAMNLVTQNKPVQEEVDVRYNVLNRIREEKNLKKTNTISEWLAENFKGSKISYGVSFGFGGLLVGLILMLEPSVVNIDDEFAKGTMSGLNYNESFFLDEGMINGAIQVKYSQGVVILDVDLKTDEALDCELKYDKSIFTLYGVKSLDPENGGEFTSQKNSIRLRSLDTNHYLVFLRSLHETPGKVYADFYKDNINVANLTMDIKY